MGLGWQAGKGVPCFSNLGFLGMYSVTGQKYQAPIENEEEELPFRTYKNQLCG